jgi:hypothetical protein
MTAGSMRVSVDGDFAYGHGGTPFKKGVRPGPEVGGGLYPAITGGDCRIRYNLGGDLVHNPFRFSPPSAEFVSVAAGARRPGDSEVAFN